MNKFICILLSLMMGSISILSYDLNKCNYFIKHENHVFLNDEKHVDRTIERIITNIFTNNKSYNTTTNIKQEIENISTIESKKEWFIAYKSIVDKYSNIIDFPETVYDYFSNEEILLIQKVVETECFDKDFNAKCNVAKVIFNRLEDGVFGEDIHEVITSPNQFVYGRNSITEDTILAVEYSFMFSTEFEGSLFFQSIGFMESFCGADYIGYDGCHYFYK